MPLETLTRPLSKGLPSSYLKRGKGISWVFTSVLVSWLFGPAMTMAGTDPPCLKGVTSGDSLLVADPAGRILLKRNEAMNRVPASTLKILTALTALHYRGPAYRFRTEFYMDRGRNLKIKGYGDPLLISEVWEEIAVALSGKISSFNDLITDDTYFSPDIRIPGRGRSTNPYDAPVGALCANFNTVFFSRDRDGRIVSAEPQTPMTPFALGKIRSLGPRQGRYTFSPNGRDGSRYAGGLLLHFLKKKGVKGTGTVRTGVVNPADSLLYTYHSRFALDEAVGKMMEFSNNFIANQIFVALGAHLLSPPATLAKGVKVATGFARKQLHLQDVHMVEGSGISRENRLSPLDMLVILRQFSPYRHLLKREGHVRFKTGSLRGVTTRAGYLEKEKDHPHYFVVFLGRTDPDIQSLVDCLETALLRTDKGP